MANATVRKGNQQRPEDLGQKVEGLNPVPQMFLSPFKFSLFLPDFISFDPFYVRDAILQCGNVTISNQSKQKYLIVK